MLKQKTVYFREEDLPLWDSIPNKAEWLHEQLAGVSVSGSTSKETQLKAISAGEKTSSRLSRNAPNQEQQPALVDQASAAFEGIPAQDYDRSHTVGTPLALQRDDLKYCKEGHAIPAGRERCLGKGCKYSV